MISLTEKLESEIRLHGAKTYPDECCGILLGATDSLGEKIIKELLPIYNAKEKEEQHNRFLITPDDLMKAELTARKEGLDILGFYHSHPDHPAIPSQFDLEHALPFYSYIIVSVEKGQSKNFTSWTMENDRSRFTPEFINYKEHS